MKDEVFNQEQSQVPDFTFNKKIAGVFDDMVNRSVPFYDEMQRMISELAAQYAIDYTSVYDLGCSTGTTLIAIDKVVSPTVNFVGIDDAEAMLHKCHEKIDEAGVTRNVELFVEDLNQKVSVQNASVVILCLTLQFVRPLYRERLLKQIFNGLVSGGVVILVEKILAEDSNFNRDFIKYYYDMKRRHQYSEMEIAQKREALENVLIPYKLSENTTLLRDAGFSHYEVFFKWYNFSGIIAKKS